MNSKIVGTKRLAIVSLVMAAVIATVYCGVTPPFQAPDEVGHYWRACALSLGDVLPSTTGGKPSALVPRGERDLVATLWVMTAGQEGESAKVGMNRIRAAAAVELHKDERVNVTFPAQFTAIPYLPQAAVGWLTMRVSAHPLYGFYLGRLANAVAALVLIGVALFRARSRSPFILALALPMLLYICSSYSADALTIGLGVAVTAFAMWPPESSRGWITFCCLALALALCKPTYFLLALLALVRMGDRRVWRVVLLIVAVTGGVLIAAGTVRRNFFPMRTDVPIDPTAQLGIVKQAPIRFARLSTADYRARWHEYLRQFVGNLGWLDVPLPHWLTDSILVLLLLSALASGVDIRIRDRVTLGLIVIASLAMISLSQYLAWSMVGGDQIDGIQGRYFLPLAPALYLLFSGTKRFRFAWCVQGACATMLLFANAFAVRLLLQRYY